MKRSILALSLFLAAFAGCTIHTQSDVNLNLSGTVTVNLVIADARKDMQTITGEAPRQVVDPSAIGLPAAPAKGPNSAGPAVEERDVAWGEGSGQVMLLTVMPLAMTEDELKNNISGRNAQVRYLLDGHLAGETHMGLLAMAPGAKPSAGDTAILTAENADRIALYALVAKRKGTSVDDVAMSYYLARLGYAKPGEWFEKRNGAGNWQWAKWSS